MIDFAYYMNHYGSIYLLGKTKSGKTTSILNYVQQEKLDYNYITIQELKNESDFMVLMESQNIYHMFLKKQQNECSTNHIRKVIIVDNLDYLQNGEKKMINLLIKYFKQPCEKRKNVFFVFIGMNDTDKKLVEFMELMDKIIHCVPFVEVDYEKRMKSVVKDYLTPHTEIQVRGLCDKNIISLCYHENIINHIQQNTHYYEEFLNQFCHGDYYDRLSFQKQLWQFNEMTFHLKVVNNHHLLKSYAFPETIQDEQEVLFTKILTKFSNEYSNLNFLIGLCRKLNCQKEELFEIVQKGEKHPGINTQEKKRLGKLMG